MNPTNSNRNIPSVTLKSNVKALASLPKLFALLWRLNPSMLAGSLLLRIVRGSLPLVILFVGKKIIDAVIQLRTHPGDGMENIFYLVALEFGLVMLMDVLNREITLLDNLLADLFSIHSSIMVVDHAATLDLEQLEDAAFYDKLERTRQQSKDRTDLLFNSLNLFQDIISVSIISAGLTVFNTWLLLLFPIAFIPSFIGQNRFNGKAYRLFLQQVPERREVEYFRNLGTNDSGAKEIRIFNLSAFITNRLKQLSEKFYRDNKQLAIRHSIWASLLAFLGNICFYAVYLFILLEAVRGRISLGELVFLAGSFKQLKSLLDGILLRFAMVFQGATYLRDFFDFFETRSAMVATSHSFPFPHPILQGFTFENVGFRYKDSARWAIRHINFSIRPGEKLALVGENGSGKTTIIKLLSRLYDPSEGRILLDGKDLSAYDLQAVRANIGVIFQDFIRYQMTLSANIAVGNISRENDHPLIVEAAQKSLADQLAKRLPFGYSQMLGKRFLKGVELSGGEWQKVALARAYLRNAQVLILDEPTAALDARAEYEVFQRFAEMTRGQAAILISHRFSTVRQADKIVVMEQGSIIETGGHEALLLQDGKYAELFKLQASGYY